MIINATYTELLTRCIARVQARTGRHLQALWTVPWQCPWGQNLSSALPLYPPRPSRMVRGGHNRDWYPTARCSSGHSGMDKREHQTPTSSTSFAWEYLCSRTSLETTVPPPGLVLDVPDVGKQLCPSWVPLSCVAPEDLLVVSFTPIPHHMQETNKTHRCRSY